MIAPSKTITVADLFCGAGGTSTGAIQAKRRLRSHGLSRTPEYRCWQTMRLRCHDPKNAAFKDYGARGIAVCDRWIDDPQAFLSDMGQKPTPAHELDRTDNSRGYAPENCRWVTREVNSRNRRSNRWIDFRGERKTLVEWALETRIGAATIEKRISAGWDLEKALTTPARNKSLNGQPKDRPHCSLCGRPSSGPRCITCSNQSRAKRQTSN